MNIEVINTGTELLLGNTLNSHLVFFARELFPLGLRIARQVTVPDGPPIREALTESFARADIVLVTGGLGPTTDDITREITAELLGLELEHHPEVMEAILARFARRGIPAGERVRRQAQVPKGAVVLPNANGTAPGLYLRATPRNPHLFLLPGPPRELKPMFTDSVIPLLRQIAPAAANLCCRTYRMVGIGESTVEELVGEQLLAIGGMELGYCARPGEVEVRCIGTAGMLEQADAIIQAHLSAQLVSTDERPLEQVIVEHLIKRGQRLAVAESCTGGFIAHRITNVPGASGAFDAGLVTYANRAKSSLLGVDPGLIARHGAVSAEVASAMAEGALRNADVDYAISATGIAGPGGATPEKPVGTLFIAVAATNKPTAVEQHRFSTDRETFKVYASQAALDLLRRNLD